VIRYVLRNYWITLKAHRPQARDDLARAEERHRAAGMSPRSPISAEVGWAAQFAKSRAKGDIIELRDCATGEKLVMLTDGRVG